MPQLHRAMEQARAAMKARNFESALSILSGVDHSPLAPTKILGVVQHISTCLTALGRDVEHVAHHRDALTCLIEKGWLQPDTITQSALDSALLLSVGAHDPIAVRKYVRFSMGQDSLAYNDFKISPLMDLPKWCKHHGVQIQLLDPAQEIAIPDTTGLGRAFSYQTRPTWHAAIPDAEIVMGWDYVIAPGGEVLVGANYLPPYCVYAFMPHVYYRALGLMAHVWPPETTYIDEDAFFLSTPERHHYGHWITDFLTRLRAWRAADRPRKLVISSQLPRKHRDLLACFGVTPHHLLECNLGQRYKFRSLQVAQTSDASAPNPQNARFLRERFAPPLDAPKRDGRRLFLTRDAGTRMIGNMDEVQPIFDAFGITTVNPAKLSYDEQKSLFADTSLVIAGFGTELYCAYNMRSGSSVIELIWDTSHATVYGPLCHMLGMRHHLMLCAQSNQPPQTGRQQDRDLMIDCADLRRHIVASLTSSTNTA